MSVDRSRSRRLLVAWPIPGHGERLSPADDLVDTQAAPTRMIFSRECQRIAQGVAIYILAAIERRRELLGRDVLSQAPDRLDQGFGSPDAGHDQRVERDFRILRAHFVHDRL